MLSLTILSPISYFSAMLAVQLNRLVDDNTMELYSVIQLDRFVCNPLPDNR